MSSCRTSPQEGDVLRVGDGNLDLDARFDGDGGDLLDNLRRRVKIDDALVDTHLEPVPSFGTFTTGGLTRGDSQGLGRHSHGSLDLEGLLLGTLDQITADLFQTFHVSRGESDSDTMNGGFLGDARLSSFRFDSCHFFSFSGRRNRIE